MKHSDWLRLKAEGENLCSILRQQGYQCRKQVRRLSWKIIKDETSYLLVWLPAPVGDWSLLPKDDKPAREKLWCLIESSLNRHKQEHKAPTITHQCIQQPEDLMRPWVIVRLLPDAQRYVVARCYNRSDAEEHRRFLNRFMPTAEFEVIFDGAKEMLSKNSV
jgi:hypothetical protein